MCSAGRDERNGGARCGAARLEPGFGAGRRRAAGRARGGAPASRPPARRAARRARDRRRAGAGFARGGRLPAPARARRAAARRPDPARADCLVRGAAPGARRGPHPHGRTRHRRRRFKAGYGASRTHANYTARGAPPCEAEAKAWGVYYRLAGGAAVWGRAGGAARAALAALGPPARAPPRVRAAVCAGGRVLWPDALGGCRRRLQVDARRDASAGTARTRAHAPASRRGRPAAACARRQRRPLRASAKRAGPGAGAQCWAGTGWRPWAGAPGKRPRGQGADGATRLARRRHRRKGTPGR
jgi:hypothetical protein